MIKCAMHILQLGPHGCGSVLFPSNEYAKNFCASSLLCQCRKYQKVKNIFNEPVPATDETVSCSKQQNKVALDGCDNFKILRASGI